MNPIVPSILTDSYEELRDLVKRSDGVFDRISLDIIDGHFANNKTVSPEVVQDIETNLRIDYQLMVVEPINWIEKCVLGQADRIIGHIEHMSDQIEFVKGVQEVGKGVGLGLDLKTSANDIDESVITNLDVVLLMSVPAGFGGQKFDEKIYEKIRKLDKIRKVDKTPFAIHIDGGVKSEFVKKLSAAGVDEFSIGKRLFDGDVSANIKKYLENLK